MEKEEEKEQEEEKEKRATPETPPPPPVKRYITIINAPLTAGVSVRGAPFTF